MTTKEILKCVKKLEGPWVTDLVKILEDRVALEETARQLGAFDPSEVVSILSSWYGSHVINDMRISGAYGCLFNSDLRSML